MCVTSFNCCIRLSRVHHSRACEFLNGRMPAKEDVLENLAELEQEADDIYEAAMKLLDSRGAGKGSTCVANVADIATVAPPTWGPIATSAATTKAPSKAAAAVASKQVPARATAATAKAGGTGTRGARNGRATSTRTGSAAANKTGLNISITSAATAKPAPAQQSILSSFASQSTHQSQRNKPADVPAHTQYISDSD